MPVGTPDSLVQALRAAEAGAGVLLGSLPFCQMALEAGDVAHGRGLLADVAQRPSHRE